LLNDYKALKRLDYSIKVQYIVLKGGRNMDAVSYSDLRQNLKSYMDKVYNDHDPLIIARKNNENLVLISIDEYNSLIETNYLLGNENNAEHLKKSIDQYSKGKAKKRELLNNE
jgi:antitoxin YefM